MMRVAGHHVLAAKSQAADVLDEISWAITVSGWMMPMAVACTLGRRGRPSLAGTVPRRPAPARELMAALLAQAWQVAGELWLQTSTGSIGGRGSSSSGLSEIRWGAPESVP
eukprot:7896274-Heterocapsa_arctica.AAC.1